MITTLRRLWRRLRPNPSALFVLHFGPPPDKIWRINGVSLTIDSTKYGLDWAVDDASIVLYPGQEFTIRIVNGTARGEVRR